MLTQLKVSGFKNLVDVDVHFGPFTCVAGANGVGKSNLFDAIKFLSAIADSKITYVLHLTPGDSSAKSDRSAKQSICRRRRQTSLYNMSTTLDSTLGNKQYYFNT